MAQFTSSGTADPSGAVVNAVLNTDTNTITYTVTTSSGLTATTTAPTSEEGNSVRILNAIRRQLTAQTGDILATARAINGIGDQLNNVQVETTNQAATAPGTVQESKPIPTNNQADPAVPPAVNNTLVVESPSPPAAVPTLAVDELSAYPPNPVDQLTVAGDPAIDELSAYPPNPVDQLSTGIDELSAYPPNPVDQLSTGIDELSAYPPNPVDVAAAATGGLTNSNSGLTTAKLNTASQATQQDASNFAAKADWRVRLSLAPGSKYLYNATPAGILDPLQATDGIIFPYTPDISVNYVANYDPTELTHSNYKFFTYRGSAVDTITLGCEFTAQDTAEANYVLAVIHFFRSITKMFYGRDQNPSNGTPPPLCYLSGLGAFQFDAHPLAITNFTYKLPTDVDYIQAGSTSTPAGVNQQNSPSQGKPGESLMSQASATRLGPLLPGALSAPPNFQQTNTGTKEPTYVPTKIMLSITAVPIVTRNDISNNFSLQKYATGELLRGTKRSGGGIW